MPQDQGITLPTFASLRLCAFALNSSKIGLRLLRAGQHGDNTLSRQHGDNTLSNAFPCKNPNLAWVFRGTGGIR